MKNRPNSDLCPAGVYDAVVFSGEDRVSHAGNEMMELVLEVYAGETSYPVHDYLTATPKMQWKIRHLCESAHVEYEKSDLPATDFVNKNVRVEIVVEEDTKYGKQSRVKDYLPRSGNGASAVAVGREAVDADIPF